MRARNVIAFVLALVIIATLCFVVVADFQVGNVRVPSIFDEDVGITQGLDLVGGAVLVFEPDLSGESVAAVEEAAAAVDEIASVSEETADEADVEIVEQEEAAPESETAAAATVDSGITSLDQITDEDMASAEAIIRKRLDSQGYMDATISREGDYGIRVEIPDVSDTEEAVALIGTTAKLEFIDADGNVVMTGAKRYVSNAASVYGQYNDAGDNGYYIQLTLTSEGRAKFKEATQNAVAQAGSNKNYITIAFDGATIMSPSVNEVIDSDSCIITGDFTQEEARSYADYIQSGQMPFTLKVAEKRTVGATLGENALKSSLLAALIGIILVMIFMISVYRLPGLVADVSLVAYITVFCLILAGFYVPDWHFVTLTLPGIAGVILSIGMAVDADCVIFERIKEELAAGKSVSAAVDAGFHRAITAVIDSNITTIIAAVVLYLFGTGTIKGFAVTLFIGVILSMLTAISLTRLLLRCIVGFGVKNPVFYGAKKNGKEDVENA